MNQNSNESKLKWNKHQNYPVGHTNLQVETYLPLVLFQTEILMQPKVADVVGINTETLSAYLTIIFTWLLK